MARQKKKSIYTDDYGKEISTKWYEKEIPYFVKNHIYPKLNNDERNNLHNFLHIIYRDIDYKVSKVSLDKLEYRPRMTGFEFEDFCAELLENHGWNVVKTKAGQDQGVDLIIKEGKNKIGVQCKKYSKPIGNKAVQEIKAGITHYNLNKGIVLSNNKFTKSAIELANSNDIILMHYLDIDKLKSVHNMP